MPRTKSYKLASPSDSSPGVPAEADIAMRDRATPQTVGAACNDFSKKSISVSDAKSFSLEEWLGRGIDAWVCAALDSLVDLRRSGRRTKSTLRNYAGGMRCFFEFLIANREAPLLVAPLDLRPLHVSAYVAWLQRQDAAGRWLQASSRVFYQTTKATLKHMMELGTINGDAHDFFPRAGLPNKLQDESRHTAFSDAEQARLAAALKADLSDAHHGRLVLNPSQTMSIGYLIVAMRTGGNVTPLLEMSRDALRPGLLPGTKRLRTVKRRSFKIEDRAVRQGRVVESPTLIPIDAVAIIERALANSVDLIGEAPTAIRDRVWLYRSKSSRSYGQVTCLTRTVVATNVRELVARRGIKGDDGNPLVVNTSRLRKSFGKRAFRLSGGDVVQTAQMLGNTPKVADTNYLKIDDQLKEEGARFFGEGFAGYLRGEGAKRKIVPIRALVGAHAAKTPVAGCSDSLFGAHAPKDGANHCDVFVTCLFCSSFAIVGEAEDLWRLFSYQVFAKHELDRFDKAFGAGESGDERIDRLRILYRLAIPFIDEFTASAFGRKLVNEARARAAKEIHPFWLQQLQRGKSPN